MKKESLQQKHCSPTLSYKKITACLLLYSTIWFIFTGTDYSSWILGAPAIILATALNMYFTSSSKWSFSLSGFVIFIIFFFKQSFLSGFDVMRRTLSPRLNINPGLISYTTFLPKGPAMIFLINTISLLPGTISADLNRNIITVHTIDKELPVWDNILNLEAKIACLFRLTSFGKQS